MVIQYLYIDFVYYIRVQILHILNLWHASMQATLTNLHPPQRLIKKGLVFLLKLKTDASKKLHSHSKLANIL